MDAFFAQVQEGFEKLGRDISVAVDKLGSDYNRANGALKRAETARKTGIVTERNASLSAFPESASWARLRRWWTSARTRSRRSRGRSRA